MAGMSLRRRSLLPSLLLSYQTKPNQKDIPTAISHHTRTAPVINSQKQTTQYNHRASITIAWYSRFFGRKAPTPAVETKSPNGLQHSTIKTSYGPSMRMVSAVFTAPANEENFSPSYANGHAKAPNEQIKSKKDISANGFTTTPNTEALSPSISVNANPMTQISSLGSDAKSFNTLQNGNANANANANTDNNSVLATTTSRQISQVATPTRRRESSTQLVRRVTRSNLSDLALEEVPSDEDAARWAERMKQKRILSKKKRAQEEEDDERVVIGTKVSEGHSGFETAYNMLTGIRVCVSRANARLDHELVAADFEEQYKLSFDSYGSELTPATIYDFKFKDYAPMVFRHLRATFKLDPADYLISLTKKYILSELGSPGKSGSFFYFSRDYKYIIKTVHHHEAKLLRKILPRYYEHARTNPNTLLSQFYGLHRVKMPYGRKIHFVIMNNLLPPHKDIHRTFDLKGSTIGREYNEELLANNPRATLKDLNWIRRNAHLEFGPTKSIVFLEQLERDIKLLQELKIMDYSLLVGIHDLKRGNEENLREKTLKVFQPGSEKEAQAMDGTTNSTALSPSLLMRTPSKMESSRKAKELRELIKNERPVPIGETKSGMPDNMKTAGDHKKDTFFYGEEGGLQATDDDDRPGEEIYYLGVIDLLTSYNIVKKMEHFFKSFNKDDAGLSAVPPQRYGDRFLTFMKGTIKTREEAGPMRL